MARAFYLFIFTAFVEGACGGMAQIAVYGLLTEIGAAPIWYGLVYAIALLPGLMFGGLALSLTRAIGHPARAMVLLYCLAAAGFIVLRVAGYHRSLGALLIFELLLSFVAVYAYPALQALTKRVTSSAEVSLQRALRLETMTFAGSAIVGIGLGSILFPIVGFDRFIEAIGLLLILNAIIAWYLSVRHYELLAAFEGEQLSMAQVYREARAEWWRMPRKRTGIGLLPSMALTTVPLIAVLPAAIGIDQSLQLFGLTMSTALLVLAARAAGQIAGPLIVPAHLIAAVAASGAAQTGLIAIFVLLYGIALQAQWASISIPCVFLAHIASNIVWSAGFYCLQTAFSETDIRGASALQSQLAQATGAGSALLGGGIMQVGGYGFVIAYSTVMAGLFAAASFGFSRQTR